MDVTFLDVDEIRTDGKVYYERDLMPIVPYKITFNIDLGDGTFIQQVNEGEVPVGTYYIYNNVINPGFRIKRRPTNPVRYSSDTRK